MRLRHLRVKNIRSYSSGALDFGAGTTLISGDVGAGKTSLLYAIEMALFGTSEVDAAYLVRHRAAHAEVAVSFEDAEHRYEISRRFRRVRRRGKETFEPETTSFSVDGAKTEYSATELRQRVIELLGFPDNPSPTAHSDLWRWAVYVPQERMRDILAAKPQDRLETVRKALGVEKYRTAAENAQDLATDLRRSAHGRRAESELLRHFDDDFASATQESDRLRVDRAALAEAIERHGDLLRATREQLAQADRAVRQAEADQRELSSLVREDEADAAALSARSRVRAERLAAIDEHRREAETARGEASDLEHRRESLVMRDAERARRRSELDSLAADLRRLHQARADLTAGERRVGPAQEAVTRARSEQDATVQSFEKIAHEGPSHEPPSPTSQTLDALDRKLEEVREVERTALTAVTRSQSSLHEFEELLHAGVCPRCGQTVRPAEFEPHRAEALHQSEDAEEHYRRSSAERARVEGERRARERYERAHERWLQAERERASARSAVRVAEANSLAATTALAETMNAVADARSRIEQWTPAESREGALRTELEATERDRALAAEGVERAALAAERTRMESAAAEGLASEVARIDGETAQLRRRSEERVRRIEALRRLVEGAEPSARLLRDSEARLRSEEAAAENDQRALVRVDTRLDEAVRRVTEAEHGRAERARRVSEAADLETKAAWVSGPFRVAVLTMEQKLLAHAQAAFERNFSRYFAALIDDAGLVARTDVAFTPAVAIEGEWTPAEALSGGERTSLALAFRLALAQVVRSLGNLRLDTILLDEPTDGFSPEQVVRMGELLDELALPQVILVSHEDELAGIADRVVRVEKVDGASVLSAGASLPATEPGPTRKRSPLESEPSPAGLPPTS
ncbi:MAG: SMC family ATPase [Thermoplasmata archaeon]